MEDSHPRLWNTKTLFYLYICDPFWYCAENADYFIYIMLEYTEKYIDNFFKYQGNMFLNIKKVLVNINYEQP